MVFADNAILANNSSLGGALMLFGGNARLVGCEFRNNHISAGSGGSTKGGGAIYATNVTSLVISNSTFTGNWARNNGTLQGGVVSINGSGSQQLVDCTFLRNGNDGGSDGGSAWFGGGDTQEIYLNASGTTRMQGVVSLAGAGQGIWKVGSGTLTMTNCLVAAQPGRGLYASAGTVIIAHSTLAENGLWGIQNGSATLTVRDSIVWDNRSGGIYGDATVTYSNVQEDHMGDGNRNVDPLFTGGYYYLSVNGLLGQAANSPCIQVGSDTAEAFGLDGRTTRTDGQADGGLVDLGFHHVSGIADSVLSNLTLYVNADPAIGNDTTGNGLAPLTAFGTVTRALQSAIQGTTINIATGTYNATLGEIFPLTMPVANLSLVGTDSATTILDAGYTANVITAIGAGRLTLANLTVKRGRQLYRAGGLYLAATQTLLTNCVVRDNRALTLSLSTDWKRGMGIYAWHGRLDLVDTLMTGNVDGDNYLGWGGAIYAERSQVTARGSQFINNSSRGNNNAFGGGLYLRNGSAWIEQTTFSTNYADFGASGGPHAGGAVYAVSSSLVITNSQFDGNYVLTGNGGVLYTSNTTVRIADCVFSNNLVNAIGSTNQLIYVIGTGNVQFDRTIVRDGKGDGIYHNGSGALAVTNSLVHSLPGYGIRVLSAGSASIASSTLADNGSWGLHFAGVNLGVENTIAWGNNSGGIFTNSASGTVTIQYTASQEELDGAENKNGMDPLFDDRVYYHLKSKQGVYRGGYFTGGVWGGKSDAASPAIDAGDPDDLAWSAEPDPNGRRVNMGAYGGTGVASLSIQSGGSVFLVR